MYIFDLDGTLVDSNGLWLEVDIEFLARRGLKPSSEYTAMMARSIFPVAAEKTRQFFGLEDSCEAIMAEWEALAGEHYRYKVPMKPGAAEFLARCRAEGRPVALFTACRPALCRAVLERFGLEEEFNHIVFAEEIGLEKHDPACFRRLSQLIGAPVGECTLFDDSPSNCATAAAAGMDTVGVYDRFYAAEQKQLRRVCRRYIRSFTELLAGP